MNLAIKSDVDSTTGTAVKITAQLGKDRPTDLFVLEDFAERSNAAGQWWGWNFSKSAYVPITSDNLGFFGQVDPSKADLVEEYTDEYNFIVAKGSPLFKWDDAILKNGDLEKLRRNSERIVSPLNTKSLGYHWDIRYHGGASDPSVNQKASKLWVVKPGVVGTPEWIGYSLEDLAANPELAKKATPVWAGPNGNPNLPAT